MLEEKEKQLYDALKGINVESIIKKITTYKESMNSIRSFKKAKLLKSMFVKMYIEIIAEYENETRIDKNRQIKYDNVIPFKIRTQS